MLSNHSTRCSLSPIDGFCESPLPYLSNPDLVERFAKGLGIESAGGHEGLVRTGRSRLYGLSRSVAALQLGELRLGSQRLQSLLS
jgi:hypothetical protein